MIFQALAALIDIFTALPERSLNSLSSSVFQPAGHTVLGDTIDDVCTGLALIVQRCLSPQESVIRFPAALLIVLVRRVIDQILEISNIAIIARF